MWLSGLHREPPALTRYVHRRTQSVRVALLLVAGVNAMLGLAPYSGVALRSALPEELRTLGLLLLSFLVLVIVLVDRWLNRLLRRLFVSRVMRLQGRVCLSCGYNLQGSPDDGRCPECGKPYCLKELRRAWKSVSV